MHYNEQMPNMKDQNASPAKLNKLDEIIAQIKTAISIPLAKRSERKLTNEGIEDTVRTIRALYRDVLNPNIYAFRLDQPQLYTEWVEASRTIHTAASHLSPEEAAVKAAADRAAKEAKAQAKAAKAMEKAALKAAKIQARQAAKAAKTTTSPKTQPAVQPESQPESPAEKTASRQLAANAMGQESPEQSHSPSSDTNGSASPAAASGGTDPTGA